MIKGGRLIRLGWIGTGGIVEALVPSFGRVGCVTVGIYGRNPSLATWQKDASLWINTPNELINKTCDMVFIAVPDAQIEPVAQKLILSPHTYSVHLSGSVPMISAKTQKGKGYGVFYPLQSCAHGRPFDFGGTPIGVSGSDSEIEALLYELAARLGGMPFYADDKARGRLHLVATIAANFSNHLLTQVAEYMACEGLEFERLRPLMREVIEKAFSMGPAKSQTGPAKRGDANTIKTHTALLAAQPNGFLRKLYDCFTEHIQTRYSSDKTAH